MHTTILQKCVVELKTDKPKIDYILGMLETVIEMSGNTPRGLSSLGMSVPAQAVPVPLEEPELNYAQKIGPIGNLS